MSMLPSDMNLNIKTRTVGYNNKILMSGGQFSLGKNDKVNTLEPAKEAIISKEGTSEGDKPKSSKIGHKEVKVVVQPAITHEDLNVLKNLTQKQSPMKRKSSLDTFSDRWFCDLAYVSVRYVIISI